jgi:hypothetical protein
MIRALILCCLFMMPEFSYAEPCHPAITQADAIRIGKAQLAKENGRKSVRHFGPYTAKLRDCDWHVIGATPPGDRAGDIVISVNAVSGKAHVMPQLRTDPRKLGELKRN